MILLTNELTIKLDRKQKKTIYLNKKILYYLKIKIAPVTNTRENYAH